MGEKRVTVSVRDSQMDNIKAILLFFVALGHTLDVYKDCLLYTSDAADD